MRYASPRRFFTRVAALRTRTRLFLLGVTAAVLVWTVATVVFPYHSLNHDEGVYLQQAAMLLEGELFLQSPVEGAFRPWFFVESASGMYSKYSPVPAAMFAVGKVLGGYRIALALIAAGVVVLAQRVVALTFDERTGYVAAVLLLGSPLFLIDASVFLPYVPTMFLNLAFAAAYLRADASGNTRMAALAGLAIAVAFFARPYTAVLFALPFIVHALWTMRDFERDVVRRQVVTAAFGLLGVVAALGYNAVVTGDPLLFPYQAFAPLDGPGFGHRELLGYSVDYTIWLGLRSNAEALWLLATRWMTAGVLGTGAALAGFAIVLRRGISARQATLAGVVLTVPIGNVYFWGTMNALGDLSEPGDGLAHFLGPYYHIDLLLPAVAFAAVGVLAVGRRLEWLLGEALDRVLGAGTGRRPILAAVVLLAAVGGASAVVVAAGPISDNATVTDRYEVAYEPFEGRSLEEGLVLLPGPYGDWLNHPFQPLRNDPGYDQGTVYALQEHQFDVLDEFPDRTAYRYVYRGQWNPGYGGAVTPALQQIRDVGGDVVVSDFSIRIPSYGERLLITVSGDEGSGYASVPVGDDGTASGTITLRPEAAVLALEGTDATARIPLDDRDRVVFRAAVDTGRGTGLTYGIEVPVERSGGEIRALTPYLEACSDSTLCGGEAAYVPEAFGEGVAINATLQSGDGRRP